LSAIFATGATDSPYAQSSVQLKSPHKNLWSAAALPPLLPNPRGYRNAQREAPL